MAEAKEKEGGNGKERNAGKEKAIKTAKSFSYRNTITDIIERRKKMKSFNVLYILGLLILSIFCSAWGYYPQIVIYSDGTIYMPMSIIVIPDTVEKAKEAGKIARYDSQNNILSTDYIIDDSNRCSVNDLSFNSKYTVLAFNGICHISGETPSDIYYYRLTIMDYKAKQILATFDKGWLFSFSPKGNAIAYAEKYPSSDNGGYTNNVWIYNFNTKLKKQIDMRISAIDINWSEHDGNIYVTNYHNVSRYNISTGAVEMVSHKGIYFSPDGRYAVARGYEDSSRIYRTSNNVEMKAWERQILGRELGEVGSPPPFMYFRMWSKKLNAVVFAVDGKGNVIFDLKQGKVIGVFSQGILGTNSDGTLVAVNATGKDKKPKVEILNLLDLIKK